VAAAEPATWSSAPLFLGCSGSIVPRTVPPCHWRIGAAERLGRRLLGLRRRWSSPEHFPATLMPTVGEAPQYLLDMGGGCRAAATSDEANSTGPLALVGIGIRHNVVVLEPSTYRPGQKY
jgi:hypothetical protein